MAIVTRQARGLVAAVVLASGTCLGLGSTALADERLSPIPFWMVPVATDSGEIATNGDALEPAYVQTVTSKGAPWIRVIFDPKFTHLTGPERAEGTTYMRITSMQDGHSQILNAETLAQWGHSSAYFNGDTVEIQVFVSKEGSAQVAVAELEVGEIIEGGTASICGPTDDRVASSDPRVGRLMPVGCTAWLFDGKPYAMLTAGHCFNGTTATVVQFNVPASLANGTLQNPPPEDQYVVQTSSVQWVETGIGNDWGHFGVFANSTTGLAPLVAQGSSFGRTAPGAVPAIRITGFGTDAGVANQTNQTHFGPFDSFAGTIIRYQADTTGGNSGSPVIRTSDGLTVGIHTNAGCFNNGGSVGGANQGTAFNNAGVLNAIANPLGIAAVTSACGLDSSGSCFEVRSTPHCNDAECCTEVCATDPFCCDTAWDDLCVERAWTDCAQCGVGTNSCYSAHSGVGCEDLACCQTVCIADPFCCSNTWDSICAASAVTNCPSCENPNNGSCYSAHPTPYCNQPSCCATVCAVDPFCCSNQWDGFCASAAIASCPSCDNPSNGNCYTAHPTPNCNQPSCCATVCAADPFCCSTEWDTLCVNRAISSCPSCDNPANGDCLVVHPTPNCNTPECCTTVCAVDPFCCSTEWDAACVQEANTSCVSTCGGSLAADCCTPHSGTHCDDADCCASVCAADPFCCGTQWDTVCANAAVATCASCAPKCPADIDGNGTVGAADLAARLNAWGTANAAAALDGNGTVGAPDLAALLNAWGPC